MAVHEDHYSDWYLYLGPLWNSVYGSGLALFAQQSGCFVVVERGRGFETATEERQPEASSDLRQGGNFGKGQMVSADYTVTPTLIFSDSNTGGVGGAICGLIGGGLGAASE